MLLTERGLLLGAIHAAEMGGSKSPCGIQVLYLAKGDVAGSGQSNTGAQLSICSKQRLILK